MKHLQATSAPSFISLAADWLAEHITAAIAERGRALVALSGGSTPGPVYRALAERPGIDWTRVHPLLMDERCVPPTHADSNQRLIRETLIGPAGIPIELCLFPDTALSPEACAAAYADRVRSALAEGPLDVALFGMGPDGHTASLFPPVPAESFGDALALHTTTDVFAVRDRVTLTIAPLAAARHQLLQLSGAEKIAVLEEMEHAKQDASRWPLQAILGEDALVVFSG